MEENHHDDDAMREIEESLRRDQEENINLPERVVIDGLEFTNIRVREISLEPKLDENDVKEPEQELELNTRSRAAAAEPAEEDSEEQREKERHDEIMREIEESMRRDQEANKNLPERVVIDGLEFTNIKVRDISLEPKLEEKEEQESEPEPKLSVAQPKSRGVLLNKAPTDTKTTSQSNATLSAKSPVSEKTESKAKQLSSGAKTIQNQNANQQPESDSSKSSSVTKFLIISASLLIVSYVVKSFFKRS